MLLRPNIPLGWEEEMQAAGFVPEDEDDSAVLEDEDDERDKSDEEDILVEPV